MTYGQRKLTIFDISKILHANFTYSITFCAKIIRKIPSCRELNTLLYTKTKSGMSGHLWTQDSFKFDIEHLWRLGRRVRKAHIQKARSLLSRILKRLLYDPTNKTIFKSDQFASKIGGGASFIIGRGLQKDWKIWKIAVFWLLQSFNVPVWVSRNSFCLVCVLRSFVVARLPSYGVWEWSEQRATHITNGI